MVRPTRCAAVSAWDVGHRTPSVDNDGKLLGRGTQVQARIKVAAVGEKSKKNKYEEQFRALTSTVH